MPEILPLMSAPFGRSVEAVQSARYVWDSARRNPSQFVIIQWTRSGEGRFAWEGGAHPVPAGHAFVALVPEASRYFFPRGSRKAWTFSWLNLYGGFAREICRDLRRAFGPVLPLPPRSPAALAFARLVEWAEARRFPDRFEVSREAYAFLMEWARQLDQPAGREDDPVEAVEQIFRARFREPWGIKEIAGETGLSREHLTRLFAARKGISPARYLRGLRAEEARRLIRQGRATLGEAALRSGFPSVRSMKCALAAR